jgi:hypothetical protein
MKQALKETFLLPAFKTVKNGHFGGKTRGKFFPPAVGGQNEKNRI